MRSPPASGRGPLLVTAQKLPQHQRGPRDPSPTHHHGKCLRPVGVFCWQGFRRLTAAGWDKGRAGTGPSSGTNLVLPPHVWENRYRNAKQQADRTLQNPHHATFAKPHRRGQLHARHTASQEPKNEAGLRHERCPALRTVSIFLIATSLCHEPVICTPAAFLCSLSGIQPRFSN